MLTANQPSLLHRRYDIGVDDAHIAWWEPSWWRSGGAFDLDGERYQVRGNAIGSRFDLIDPTGRRLASVWWVGWWVVRTMDLSC